MIDFKPLTFADKPIFETLLRSDGARGCEYNFTNLFLWGQQKAALIDGFFVIFAQYNRRSVYLYPVGTGDKKAVLDAVIEDAKKRGISCRFNGLTKNDCQELQALYPDRFCYHYDRDSFDYVYDINALADLKGKKLQRKRNHLNRFRQEHPDCVFEPITDENTAQAEQMVKNWYALRLEENPHADYQMEQTAIFKALKLRKELDLQGMLLKEGEKVLAMTLGSFLNEDTFDVQFEKALDRMDNAYGAINQAFAAHLRDKYPQLKWLDREEDMGIEGLRKAKLSYYPAYLTEKCWVHLKENSHED